MIIQYMKAIKDVAEKINIKIDINMIIQRGIISAL